jgi:hypothetical protein
MSLYGKGPKGKALRLHSQIVRSRGHCEAAGEYDMACSERLECAHIMGRGMARTAADLDNAYCLCWTHHKRFTDDPVGWYLFCVDRMGETALLALRRRALDTGGQRIDWQAKISELESMVGS